MALSEGNSSSQPSICQPRCPSLVCLLQVGSLDSVRKSRMGQKENTVHAEVPGESPEAQWWPCSVAWWAALPGTVWSWHLPWDKGLHIPGEQSCKHTSPVAEAGDRVLQQKRHLCLQLSAENSLKCPFLADGDHVLWLGKSKANAKLKTYVVIWWGFIFYLFF